MAKINGTSCASIAMMEWLINVIYTPHISNFCQVSSHCNLQVWANDYNMNFTKIDDISCKTPSVYKKVWSCKVEPGS